MSAKTFEQIWLEDNPGKPLIFVPAGNRRRRTYEELKAYDRAYSKAYYAKHSSEKED